MENKLNFKEMDNKLAQIIIIYYKKQIKKKYSNKKLKRMYKVKIKFNNKKLIIFIFQNQNMENIMLERLQIYNKE